jgi:hypothetical protein
MIGRSPNPRGLSSKGRRVFSKEGLSLQLWNGCAYRRESDRTLREGFLRSRFTRHFVPGYDRTVPPGLEGKPLLRGNKSSQTFLNLAPFNPGAKLLWPVGPKNTASRGVIWEVNF